MTIAPQFANIHHFSFLIVLFIHFVINQAQNDKINQTGSGKQAKLTEFQELCLAFVRAAKGDAVVDCIHGVTEPSGSSAATLTLPKKLSSGKRDQPNAKGNKNKPTSTIQKKDDSEWKKDFFSSIQSIEESRASIVEKKNALKCYNLALKNMYYEKQLCKSQFLLTMFLCKGTCCWHHWKQVGCFFVVGFSNEFRLMCFFVHQPKFDSSVRYDRNQKGNANDMYIKTNTL